MLNDLLDNNSIDNAKKVMISELDININNSENESYREIEHNEMIKNTEPQKEFKSIPSCVRKAVMIISS